MRVAETRPRTVHAAADVAADDHHRVAVPVIGAPVAVLGRGAPEFRHRDDDRVGKTVAEVRRERREAARELVEPVRDLAGDGALVDVVIPVAQLGERDLEADVGLRQPRNLRERPAERAVRILNARRRPVGAAGHLLQRAHGGKRVVASSAQTLVGRPFVLLLERVGRAAHAEFVDAADGERRRRSSERSRHGARERDPTQRVAFPGRDLQVTIQPPVACRLHAWRRGLHVVLRVEMRAGVVRRSARVDDGERPVVPERLERRHRRVQAEEAVEVDRRAHRVAAGTWNRNRRTQAVVVGVAVRDDHVEAVHGAALEDGDEQLAPGAGGGRRAAEERGGEAEREHRHRAGLEEQSSIHRQSQKRWNSGEPICSASSRAGGAPAGSVTPGMFPDARRVAKFMRVTSPPADSHASAVSL